MKKSMLLTAMILALMAPGAAWSQSTPPGNDNNSEPPPSMGTGEAGGQKFQEHKAELLQRMNEHLVETQKRIACVQAATNHEALHACMPERGSGGGHGQPPMGSGGPGEGPGRSQ